MDFGKKLNLLWAVANQQATNDKGREFVDNTCKAVFAVNDDRLLVIHSSFEPAQTGGVQFKRTVPKKGRVRVGDQVWGDKKFSDQYTKMKKLADDLDKLIDVTKPVPVPDVTLWVQQLSQPIRIATGLGKASQFRFDPRGRRTGKVSV